MNAANKKNEFAIVIKLRQVNKILYTINMGYLKKPKYFLLSNVINCHTDDKSVIYSFFYFLIIIKPRN